MKPIAYRRNGKVLGILEDKTFTKSIDSKKHLLHSFGDVPAIDSKAWEHAQDFAGEIKIKTQDREFYSSKDTFQRNKFKIDFGYGTQFTMDLKHWTIKDNNQTLF